MASAAPAPAAPPAPAPAAAAAGRERAATRGRNDSTLRWEVQEASLQVKHVNYCALLSGRGAGTGTGTGTGTAGGGGGASLPGRLCALISGAGRSQKAAGEQHEVGEEKDGQEGREDRRPRSSSRRRKAKAKQLLFDVSFHANAGELVAVMGPSGAGKSTLLDLVADRTAAGVYSGQILVNGAPRSRFFCRQSAYVRSDDVHLPMFTVAETLMYAARFKLDSRFTEERRRARVRAVLEMLELDSCAGSRVGGALQRGISGGQLRRLSIGVEMVDLPSMIFLDEPTSGLDSDTALSLMQSVRQLANQRRTMLATIHQPSERVFSLFDKLLLLSQGRVVYFGLVEAAAEYFTSAPLRFILRDGRNPADFVMDIANGVAERGRMHSGVEDAPLSALELAASYEASAFAAHAIQSPTSHAYYGSSVDMRPSDAASQVGKHTSWSTTSLILNANMPDSPPVRSDRLDSRAGHWQQDRLDSVPETRHDSGEHASDRSASSEQGQPIRDEGAPPGTIALPTPLAAVRGETTEGHNFSAPSSSSTSGTSRSTSAETNGQSSAGATATLTPKAQLAPANAPSSSPVDAPATDIGSQSRASALGSRTGSRAPNSGGFSGNYSIDYGFEDEEDDDDDDDDGNTTRTKPKGSNMHGGRSNYVHSKDGHKSPSRHRRGVGKSHAHVTRTLKTDTGSHGVGAEPGSTESDSPSGSSSPVLSRNSHAFRESQSSGLRLHSSSTAATTGPSVDGPASANAHLPLCTGENAGQARAPRYKHRHATGAGSQLVTLLDRSWQAFARNRNVWTVQIFKNVAMGLIVAVLFVDQGHIEQSCQDDDRDDDDGCSPLMTQYGQPTTQASNVSSLLYFFMMQCMMNNLLAIPQLCSMDIQYRRELGSNMYSSFPYWLSAAVVHLPFLMVMHMIWTVLVFFTVDLAERTFWYFWIITLLATITTRYLAMFLAAVTRNAQVALAIFPILFFIFGNFAGFTVRLPSMSPIMKLLSKLTYSRWVYQGLVVKEFEPIDGGNEYLREEFGFNGFDAHMAIPLECIFVVVFGLATYLALRPKSHRLQHVRGEDAFQAELIKLNGDESDDDPHAITQMERPSAAPLSWSTFADGDDGTGRASDALRPSAGEALRQPLLMSSEAGAPSPLGSRDSSSKAASPALRLPNGHADQLGTSLPLTSGAAAAGAAKASRGRDEEEDENNRNSNDSETEYELDSDMDNSRVAGEISSDADADHADVESGKYSHSVASSSFHTTNTESFSANGHMVRPSVGTSATSASSYSEMSERKARRMHAHPVTVSIAHLSYFVKPPGMMTTCWQRLSCRRGPAGNATDAGGPGSGRTDAGEASSELERSTAAPSHGQYVPINGAAGAPRNDGTGFESLNRPSKRRKHKHRRHKCRRKRRFTRGGRAQNGDESKTALLSDSELLSSSSSSSESEDGMGGSAQSARSLHTARAMLTRTLSSPPTHGNQHGTAAAAAGPTAAGPAVGSNTKPQPRKSTPRGDRLCLLDDICGVVRAGQLCAIMGPSGAGKTTLLDLVAGRKTQGEILGAITFNDEPMTRDMKRRIAYVMQDDVHIPTLTAKETLMFSARLRLPEVGDPRHRERRVRLLLHMLGLTKARHTRVGGTGLGGGGQGLSSGQRRRLTIGVEMVCLPDVLFLDEPTTGLDATTAWDMVSFLSKLAGHGRTIMCTIHQPSAPTFAAFDSLLLLAQGRVVYFGPVDGAVHYFATCPFHFRMPNSANPADFVISVASGTAHCRPDEDTRAVLYAAGCASHAPRGAGSGRGRGSGLPGNATGGITGGRAMGAAAPNSHMGMGVSADQKGGGHLRANGGSAGSGGGAGGGIVNRKGATSAGEDGDWFHPSPDLLFEELVQWPEYRVIADRTARLVKHEDARVPRSVKSHAVQAPQARGSIAQAMVLAERAVLKMRRSVRPQAVSVVRHIIGGLFFGAIFFQLSHSQVTERQAIAFYALIYMTQGAQTIMPLVFEERLLFYRETAAAAHGTVAYWLSTAATVWPMALLNSFLFTVLIYPMARLHPGWEHAGYFYIVCVLVTLAATYMSQLIAALAPSPQAAVSLHPVVFFFFAGSAGFLVRIPSFPHMFSWAPDVSFMRWGYQGLLLNEILHNPFVHFLDDTDDDDEDEEEAKSDFLHDNGFQHKGYMECILPLVCSLLVFRLLTLIAFKFLRYERR